MDNLGKSFDNAERIGVIGSPSTTSGLTIDVLGTAVNKRLVGNMSVFKYNQDDQDHYALGQITEITMQNVWAQDPTMRGIIRQKGVVAPITERQDVHTARMVIGSVFSRNESSTGPSILGTVPATGTSVKLIDKGIMDSLLEEYQKELFYIGNIYGTKIKMPMWLKHFGKGRLGSGEAYHIGVFGKTGSGKSVLARMLMAGYARHKQLSIFILDPQGEFSRDLEQNSPLREVLEKRLSRKVEVYHVQDLALENWDLFKDILVSSDFFRDLGIFHEDNQIQAASQVERILSRKITQQQKIDSNQNELTGSIPLERAYEKDAFKRVWKAFGEEDFLKKVYSGKVYQERVASFHETADPDDYYIRWMKIANLFRKGRSRRTASELAAQIDESDGLVTVIDLSSVEDVYSYYWNEAIKLVVVGEFLREITKAAESKFKESKQLNCLVVVDEAHRLAPRETPEQDAHKRVKELLVDGIRTTRKYGLGWMFISQTISSLDREIINQTRIYVFGFGLAYGIERQALREIIGGAEEAMNLYQMFRDPQSSLGESDYPFMTMGPISPLSFSGTPLFFSALKYPPQGAGPNEFLDANFGLNKQDEKAD